MGEQSNLLSQYSPQELSERVKSTIAGVKYITIATVSEQGEPWNAPTFFAYDEAYNLYWGSPTESQHSKNIKANSQVYIVIYDSTVTPGTGKGVYIRAKAHMLSKLDEARTAFDTIMKRRGDIPYWPYWDFEEYSPEKPIELFQARPQKIYTNGGIMKDGVYVDSRVEVKLESLR